MSSQKPKTQPSLPRRRTTTTTTTAGSTDDVALLKSEVDSLKQRLQRLSQENDELLEKLSDSKLRDLDHEQEKDVLNERLRQLEEAAAVEAGKQNGGVKFNNDDAVDAEALELRKRLADSERARTEVEQERDELRTLLTDNARKNKANFYAFDDGDVHVSSDLKRRSNDADSDGVTKNKIDAVSTESLRAENDRLLVELHGASAIIEDLKATVTNLERSNDYIDISNRSAPIADGVVAETTPTRDTDGDQGELQGGPDNGGKIDTFVANEAAWRGEIQNLKDDNAKAMVEISRLTKELAESQLAEHERMEELTRLMNELEASQLAERQRNDDVTRLTDELSEQQQRLDEAERRLTNELAARQLEEPKRVENHPNEPVEPELDDVERSKERSSEDNGVPDGSSLSDLNANVIPVPSGADGHDHAGEEAAYLKGELEAREQEIATRNEEITARDQEIARLKQELASKDKQLEEAMTSNSTVVDSTDVPAPSNDSTNAAGIPDMARLSLEQKDEELKQLQEILHRYETDLVAAQTELLRLKIVTDNNNSASDRVPAANDTNLVIPVISSIHENSADKTDSHAVDLQTVEAFMGVEQNVSGHELKASEIRKELEIVKQQLTACRQELDRYKQELVACRNDLESTHKELVSCRNDLGKSNQELATRYCDLEKANDALTLCRNDIEKNEQELATCHLDLDKTNQELVKFRKDLEKNEQELATCRSDPDTVKQELIKCRNDFDVTNQELTTCRSDLEKTRQALETSNAELETVRREMETYRKEIDGYIFERDRSRKELTTCHRDLDTCQRNLARCRHQLDTSRMMLMMTKNNGEQTEHIENGEEQLPQLNEFVESDEMPNFSSTSQVVPDGVKQTNKMSPRVDKLERALVRLKIENDALKVRAGISEPGANGNAMETQSSIISKEGVRKTAPEVLTNGAVLNGGKRREAREGDAVVAANGKTKMADVPLENGGTAGQQPTDHTAVLESLTYEVDVLKNKYLDMVSAHRRVLKENASLRSQNERYRARAQLPSSSHRRRVVAPVKPHPTATGTDYSTAVDANAELAEAKKKLQSSRERIRQLERWLDEIYASPEIGLGPFTTRDEKQSPHQNGEETRRGTVEKGKWEDWGGWSSRTESTMNVKTTLPGLVPRPRQPLMSLPKLKQSVLLLEKSEDKHQGQRQGQSGARYLSVNGLSSTGPGAGAAGTSGESSWSSINDETSTRVNGQPRKPAWDPNTK